MLGATFLCASGSYAKEAEPNDYRGIDEAATAALRAAKDCSRNRYECGGVIVRTDADRYIWLPVPPESDHRKYGVVIRELAVGVKEGVIVADFHVHICSRHNREFSPFFSPADAIVDAGFHIVGYMYSFCDHMVHRYDPSQDDKDDEEVDFKSGHKLYLTIGHISGWIP